MRGGSPQCFPPSLAPESTKAHIAAAVDIALALGILAALLLLAAASEWLQVSRRVDQAARVSALGRAASVTALALGLSGIALLSAGVARFW